MDPHVTTLPAASAPPDAHAESHEPPKYFSIWFVLLIVTLAEVVFAAIFKQSSLFKGVGLVVMALYKVVLVALYFMHLKFEKKTLWIVAAAPLIFGVILSIGAYPDSEHSTDAKKNGDLPNRAVQHD